jgi:ureidoglycolate lyase
MADSETKAIKVKRATPENTARFGSMLATDPAITPLPITFYEGAVIVRRPAVFDAEGSAADIVVCCVNRRPFALDYLERHPLHTQAFLPLSGKPFVVAFAPPMDTDIPPLESVEAFWFDGSGGFMMHKGVWHEFPFAMEDGTDLVVIASRNTNDGLDTSNVQKGEAVGPDLEKRNVMARTGTRVELDVSGL